MAENGIPLSWQVALPDLNNVFNNLLGGAGSANSSGISNRLEGLETSYNDLQSTGTTTVTIPSQGTDTFASSASDNLSGGDGNDRLRPNGLNPPPSASSTTSSSSVGNTAPAGNVDQKVYSVASQAFQNYGSGTSGVSDAKCFPVVKEAWLNLYNTDLTNYHAGDKSHRGKSVDQLANILPSSKPGTVMYLNNSPGADPNSMNMSYMPHWAIYVGGGKIVDNWANDWSIAEFINKYKGDGRLIDEIMPPPK